ncbi:hypothetical protein T492DRAFT_860384 [Pavlovales sp. CCMP2436]|nr:hypothetical protein T492DRAFT_860384 [Pavlovales sp. CCMP2436]
MRARMAACLFALALMVVAQLTYRADRLLVPAATAAADFDRTSWPAKTTRRAHGFSAGSAEFLRYPNDNAGGRARAPSRVISLVALRDASGRFVRVEGASSELAARLADATGASSHFELWATAASCAPPGIGAFDSAQGSNATLAAFALRSRRNGRFVRVQPPGSQQEWDLTADHWF